MKMLFAALLLFSSIASAAINFPVDVNYPPDAQWYSVYAPGGVCSGEPKDCILSGKLTSQEAFAEGYPDDYPIGRDPNYDFVYIVPVSPPPEDPNFFQIVNDPILSISNNTYTNVYTPTRVPDEQVERLVDAAEGARHNLIDPRVVVDGILRNFVCTGALLNKTLNNENPPPALIAQCQKMIVQATKLWNNRLHANQLKAQAATIVPDDLTTFPEPEPLQ